MSTEIQCECGKFRAQIEMFPSDTPGRCYCYCDDCQTYLHHLGRADLLDAAGGTEIIPVYPKHLKILTGAEQLKCARLAPKGLFRYWAGCCRTPICNTTPGFPWAGMFGRVFRVKDSQSLEKSLGAVKSRIHGKWAKGGKLEGASEKTNLKDLRVIAPFVLKGLFLGKGKSSPLFHQDGKTSITEPVVLSPEERNQLRAKLGFPQIIDG